PLRLLRPLAELPLDSEQKHRHLEYRDPARVPLLLVTEATERFVTHDGTDQASLFVRFARGRRSSSQVPDGPALGNDPLAAPCCRPEQHPDPGFLGDREWQSAILLEDPTVVCGHLGLQLRLSVQKHIRPRRCNSGTTTGRSIRPKWRHGL